MRIWVKLTIIISIALILIPLGLWGGFKVLGWLNYRFGAHLDPVKFMYYWCAPKELIGTMEDLLGLKFPDGITKIKAAKTVRSEGTVAFVIRFTAEPNVVDAFVRSFPGEIRFFEYDPGYDSRAKRWSAPVWFKDPIRKGRIGNPLTRPGITVSDMYIDMTQEKRYVVYWSGYYWF